MKKFLGLAVLVALAATPAMAVVSIVGSKHDMIASGFAIGSSNTEVCIFCHTPHGAQSTEPLAPLWNNTAAATVAGFYGDGTPRPGSDIQFATSVNLINATDARLCLACHDGGVGLPVNGPNTGSITLTGAAAMSANTLLGTMSNDHPIGMDLGANPTALDAGIHPLATIRTNFGNVDPFFGGDPDVPDGINIMYCSSCHDVHDGDPLMKPFLRKNNYGSALCKACHKK